ncbi:hypothetical protein [Phenylobacterium sp.]|jgi:hypothetical protein|uniref:terminase small subunit-like protein n=1 Tax=Phenylobacterium sp. TaxID=1871053 RepID=UPI002F41852B
MDHEPGYKPSAFSWAMGRLILQRMGERETMRQITADPAMPSYATVFRWVQVHEDFGAQYRAVRLVIAQVARQEGDARRAARAGIKAAQAAARAEAKGKAPRHWKSGPKSSFTPERAAAVLEAIREGASLSAVVATPGMPSFKVFYTWVRTRPEFREAYMDACSERAFMLRLEIEDRALNANPFTLARAKREVAALEGRIGRLRPKVYRVRELDW